MNIRKIAFWGLDYFRVRRIARPYAKIKHLMESREDIQPYIGQKMNEPLKYVTKNIPYYTAYSEIFNAPVFRQYGCMDFGVLGVQTKPDSEDYLTNRAYYFIEIVDLNEDKPLPIGKKGRIVITDFVNRAMPLIRYDTSDIGSQIETMVGRGRGNTFCVCG